MFASVVIAFATAYLFAGLFALAPRKIGYIHIKHTISEIGEMGAPDQRLVALGLFLPIGMAALMVAYHVQLTSSAAATLALCIAIGYIGAALFPCDSGCPLYGSTRHTLHVIAGAIQYIGGGRALMTLAEHFGQPFETAGLIVFCSVIALSFPHSLRGIVQRIAEVCLFGGLALAVWRIGAVNLQT